MCRYFSVTSTIVFTNTLSEKLFYFLNLNSLSSLFFLLISRSNWKYNTLITNIIFLWPFIHIICNFRFLIFTFKTKIRHLLSQRNTSLILKVPYNLSPCDVRDPSILDILDSNDEGFTKVGRLNAKDWRDTQFLPWYVGVTGTSILTVPFPVPSRHTIS